MNVNKRNRISSSYRYNFIPYCSLLSESLSKSEIQYVTTSTEVEECPNLFLSG